VAGRESSASLGGMTSDNGTGAASLDDPGLFINRELSWLQFDRRVLEEAMDPDQPLLERVKFLAICASNLDEFFMSRVPGLRRQAEEGALESAPDAMHPQEVMVKIKEEVDRLIEDHACAWEEIRGELAEQGIGIVRMSDLSGAERADLKAYFESEMLPVLTPLAFDAAHPFPFISGGSINLAVLIEDRSGRERLARVKVSGGLFPRFVSVGRRGLPVSNGRFVLLEDLMADNLDMLFHGVRVISAHPFRVTRDAEIDLELEDSSDLLTAVEKGLEYRRTGDPSRLQVGADMPDRIAANLAHNLELTDLQVYRSTAPLASVDLWELHRIQRQDLKDPPFLPYVPPSLSEQGKVLTAVQAGDELLYHPYDSFQPVISFLRQASVDPAVMAIKMTFYRVDPGSPLMDALLEARRNGKAVSAVLELKAKFDETNNMSWARRLEQAGVHVAYGPADIKVHAKMCLVVKRGRRGMERICHLSSGNYNSQTARTYADIGYMTADPAITADVADLFNSLTGYCDRSGYRRLLVSPGGIRQGLLERIEREIEHHQRDGGGRIAFKLNSLVDKGMVQALYKASMAGVRVDLNVRGICCLRPGVPGISDNIRVTSIVSRFLEHARIYYFRNGGEEEVLLGSADLMPRNLDRRVEVLFPVADDGVRNAVIHDILEVHLADDVKARELRRDGEWARAPRAANVDSQKWMLEHKGAWHGGR